MLIVVLINSIVYNALEVAFVVAHFHGKGKDRLHRLAFGTQIGVECLGQMFTLLQIARAETTAQTVVAVAVLPFQLE